VLDAEGTALKSYAVMDPDESITKRVSMDLAPGESVIIRIGNNYTGFAEYTIESSAETSTQPTTSTSNMTTSTTPETPTTLTIEMLVIIAGAGVAVVVGAIIILKRRT